MGSISNGWKIDYQKFQIYLKEKYRVDKAYYFIGYFSEKEDKLYKKLNNSGFILFFKNHNPQMNSLKKGNVDSDIIFNIMKLIAENVQFEKIILVSGDGDYKNTVDYLIYKKKLEKILFPTKNSSSLYKNLSSMKFDYINNFKKYIEYK